MYADDLSKLIGLSDELKNLEILTPDIAKEIGETLTDMIRTRVRLGFGVLKSGASKKKFRRLEDSTIADRLRLKESGELSPMATYNKATMTRFGSMMDSLFYELGKNEVTLLFSGDDEIIKAGAQQVGRLNRPFFYLSDVELKAARALVQQAIDDYVDSIADSLQ
jgi:hypothetical protein